MSVGQLIRFKAASREGSWAKGDYGKIDQVLATRPAATADIYLIRMEEGQIVWATHEDVEFCFGEQLTLF